MKVLIVEDDPGIRGLLETLVRTDGHEPLLAADGEEGFDVFQSGQPDLIISDLGMPRVNGLELLEKIRHLDRETYFVVMTGNGSEQLAARALDLRANNYLHKPVDMNELRALLKKCSHLLKRRRITSEVRRLVSQRETVVEIPNRLDIVPEIVDILLADVAHLYPREVILNMQLGLYELIVNAIEHGNLGVTFEEKSRILEKSPELFASLIETRAREPQYKERRAKATFIQHRDRCEWIIEDQGAGFDPDCVPSPLQEGMEGLCGRGIFLARLQFDDVNYHGKGNKVSAVRRIAEENQPATLS